MTARSEHAVSKGDNEQMREVMADKECSGEAHMMIGEVRVRGCDEKVGELQIQCDDRA
jgi:hypothetical protein